MPSAPGLSLLLVAAAVLAVSSSSSVTSTTTNQHVLWSDENCALASSEEEPVVVDYICSQDKHCNTLAKEACQEDGTCLWKSGRCMLNRDRTNNVCSPQEKVHKYCPDVLEGKCPADFQIPQKCCKPKQRKYNRVLKTDSPDLVCCNVPCAEMKENSGCDLPDRCGPQERSLFGGYGGNSHHGPIFNDHLVNQKGYGSIIPYTGFEDHDYLPSEFSHVPDVEEITVDDLMHSLVEALSNDKDAYEYNKEIYSDPYTGKVKSGGELGGLSFPNPDIFLSQIYGNHYGSALGQLSYHGGGIGYGGRPYSISPQDIHGPSYFDPIYHGGYYGGGNGHFGGNQHHGGGSSSHNGGGGGSSHHNGGGRGGFGNQRHHQGGGSGYGSSSYNSRGGYSSSNRHQSFGGFSYGGNQQQHRQQQQHNGGGGRYGGFFH